MRRFLLYLWQLPQNLLGLIVIYFSSAHWDDKYKVWSTPYNFGVSLGKYIIICLRPVRIEQSIKHEQGHQVQSKIYGPLYLLTVGIPSILGNLWDRLFHKKWTYMMRQMWYYNLIWEKRADKFGKVKRQF